MPIALVTFATADVALAKTVETVKGAEVITPALLRTSALLARLTISPSIVATGPPTEMVAVTLAATETSAVNASTSSRAV